MYLTRFFLDPTSRYVRADVADPENLHKTVMRLFPMNAGPEPRKAHCVLHRLDESQGGQVMLLVQSLTRPSPASLSAGYLLDLDRAPDLISVGVDENPSIRCVAEERATVRAGDRFNFRLKANTTKKIGTKTGADGKRQNGKRVPLQGDDACLGWLERHGATSGFKLAGARVTGLVTRGRDVRLGGTVFDGALEVTNSAAFREALQVGIGPGKAYGFGLLSVRRIRPE